LDGVQGIVPVHIRHSRSEGSSKAFAQEWIIKIGLDPTEEIRPLAGRKALKH